MKLSFKKIMFASLKDGGHLQVAECAEYPDLTMIDKKINRKSQWKKTYTWRGGGVELTDIEVVKQKIQKWLDRQELKKPL